MSVQNLSANLNPLPAEIERISAEIAGLVGQEETLTAVLSLAEHDADRSECLEQVTYVFHLLPASKRPRLVATAR